MRTLASHARGAGFDACSNIFCALLSFCTLVFIVIWDLLTQFNIYFNHCLQMFMITYSNDILYMHSARTENNQIHCLFTAHVFTQKIKSCRCDVISDLGSVVDTNSL